MSYDPIAIPPNSYERRSDNIDKIFSIQDKIDDLKREYRADTHRSSTHIIGITTEAFTLRIKALELQLKRLTKLNLRIDEQIWIKYTLLNGSEAEYRNWKEKLRNVRSI